MPARTDYFERTRIINLGMLRSVKNHVNAK